MYCKMTIKELFDKFDKNSTVEIICEDEKSIVFVYKKIKEKLQQEDYSFEVGV